MGTTTNHNLRYPEDANAVAVPADVKKLADDVDAKLVSSAGGTVSGNISFTGTTVVQTPTANNHAATKLYVDNADNAINTELGTNPSGTFSTVKDRLDSHEAKVGNLLTANQASGTDALGDTTGFSTGGASVASDTGWSAQGSRSVKVTIVSATYPAAVVGSPYPAVTVAETVTFYAEANTGTLSGGSLSNLRMLVDFLNSGLSQVGSTAIIAASNGVFRHTTTVPATAVWARLRMGINSGSANVGEYFYADKFGVWKGAGGQWAMPGTPIVGQSHIAVNNAVDLSGTGVPNGVVTAAPGSSWLQIGDAVTVSGNLLWRKTSGTGNTGWVPEGALADTGYRRISYDSGTANWTAGSLLLRRVGNLVQVNFNNVKMTSLNSKIYDLPAGFLNNYEVAVAWCREGVATGSVVGLAVTRPIVAQYAWPVAGFSHSPTYGYSGVVSYITPEAWPSSLPGSAA